MPILINRSKKLTYLMGIETALSTIQKLPRPAIVAISGFGGSGKSTIAHKIAAELQAPVIGVDSFWQSTTCTTYQYWEVVDFDRLVREILQPFSAGSAELRYGEFDWEKNEVSSQKTIPATDFLIIEGIGVFRPDLMQYFSYTIWIECPLEIAIARGKKRDRDEYGVPQDELWDGI